MYGCCFLARARGRICCIERLLVPNSKEETTTQAVEGEFEVEVECCGGGVVATEREWCSAEVRSSSARVSTLFVSVLPPTLLHLRTDLDIT
jgi:hypothetical protein